MPKMPDILKFENESVAVSEAGSSYSGGGKKVDVIGSRGTEQAEIVPIRPTSPVVSSKDNAQGFNQDSTKLDGFTSGLLANNDANAKKDTDTVKTGVDVNTDTGKVENSGDPVLDKLNAWEKQRNAQLQADGEAKKAEYKSLYTTSLAAIDSTTQSTIDKINTSFDKRIKEQERINAIDVGRVKAYGLSEGGRFTPIAFSDAITTRETEASDKVSSLEGERNSLISQAKAARDEGASKLLREKLADLDKVDEQIRTQLKSVEEESDRQYKLLRDFRKEEEAKHAEQIKKVTAQLSALAPRYIDDFDKMGEAEQDKFIQQLTKQTGLDYATIFGILQGASVSSYNQKADRETKALDIQSKKTTIAEKQVDIKSKEADLLKKPYEIEAEKALVVQRRASAAASYAAAAKSARTTEDEKKLTEAETLRSAMADMSSEIEQGNIIGKDGYISPTDYRKALRAWLGKGYSAEQFNKNFASYRNPKDSGYDVE